MAKKTAVVKNVGKLAIERLSCVIQPGPTESQGPHKRKRESGWSGKEMGSRGWIVLIAGKGLCEKHTGSFQKLEKTKNRFSPSASRRNTMVLRAP